MCPISYENDAPRSVYEISYILLLFWKYESQNRSMNHVYKYIHIGYIRNKLQNLRDEGYFVYSLKA